MVRILILADKNQWDHRYSRVRFHHSDAIIRHPEVVGIKDGPNFSGWVDVPTSVKKYRPDVIYWYKPLEMVGYDKVPDIPKIITYNEMYDVNWSTKEVINSHSNIVICHHDNDVLRYPHLIEKGYWLKHIPHSAEKYFFHDYKLPKDRDVLLTGIVGLSKYPFRNRLLNLLKHPRLKKYKCEYLSPNRGIKDVDDQCIDFSKQMNRTKVVLSCSSEFKYVLAKYIETPMSHTFHLSDRPDERGEFFDQFMDYIEMEMSDDEIVDKIIYWVEHDEEREKKVDLGYELMMENYTQEHYAIKFVNLVKEYLEHESVY